MPARRDSRRQNTPQGPLLNQESTIMAEAQLRKETENKLQSERFIALDGLRGIAVLIILLAHGSEYDLLPETFLSYGGCD